MPAARHSTPEDDPTTALAAAIARVVEAQVDARVEARLAKLGLAPGVVDPVIAVGDALPVSRSRSNALCRSGRIEGARLVGRTWCARRSAIDAYLAALPAPVPPPSKAKPDALDAALDDLGFGHGGRANDAAKSAAGSSR